VKINPRTVMVRVFVTGLVALMSLLVAPAAGQARVSGGCTASATASKSGSVDLTTATVWHVTDADVISGEAKAQTSQLSAHLKVVIFGVGLPLLDRQGNSTAGAAGPYRIADYDHYSRVLSVAGTSSSCDGAVLIIVDDVAPLATWAGILGLIATLLGLIGLIASLFLQPTGSSRVVGIIVGFLAGLGVGLLLQEAATLDPANPLGLALPVAGAVIGLVVPGVFHRRSAAGLT
jgi:hypothetical protein